MIEVLKIVLKKKTNQDIIDLDYQARDLPGGTFGYVTLYTGTARTLKTEFPYQVVLKISKQYGQMKPPGHWCREYELFNSQLGTTFSKSFRWPEVYLCDLYNNVTYIWMEYIDGISGNALTSEMYEQAAFHLGSWQGKLYAEKPAFLSELTNLYQPDSIMGVCYMTRSMSQNLRFLKHPDCELPKHLCQMILDVDASVDHKYSRIQKLPVVFSHGDFWVTNIIYQKGIIYLIDWEVAGWNYLGDDLASLIADESDLDKVLDHYQRCTRAYFQGFSEHTDVISIKDHCVLEMIQLRFVYKSILYYITSEKPEDKVNQINTLQKFYELTTKDF